MKKGIILLIFILSINFVLADTTFFEGELGYRDDFIMGNPVGEIIPVNIPEIEGGGKPEVFAEDGGGFIIPKEGIDKKMVCPSIANSLKKHIKEKRNIDYSEKDIEILTREINQEFGINLPNIEVRDIINNYEEVCDTYFPLSGGLALGRSRDLLTLAVMIFTVIALLFIIYIGNKIKYKLKKRNRKK